MACAAIATAGSISDIKSIGDALDIANETMDKIRKLEEELANCPDEAKKIEIELEIRELKLKRAEEIKTVTAEGIAGGICGLLSPF